MGLLVNVENYSDKEFQLNGQPQVNITFNETLSQSPIDVLLANAGTTSMQVTQNALSGFATDQYSMSFEYVATDNTAYFGIACIQYVQVFDIGGDPDWTVLDQNGNWIGFTHSATPYIWNFPEITIRAVPTVTHSDVTVNVTITQNHQTED